MTEWSATLVNLRPSSPRIYLDNIRLHVLPELGAVQQDVADRLDALARAAVADTIPAVVPLDARDFRGMNAQTASSRRSGNRP